MKAIYLTEKQVDYMRGVVIPSAWTHIHKGGTEDRVALTKFELLMASPDQVLDMPEPGAPKIVDGDNGQADAKPSRMEKAKK